MDQGLVVADQPAGGDVGGHQRARAIAEELPAFGQQAGHERQEVFLAASVGGAQSGQALADLGGRMDAQRLVVDEGAVPAQAMEEFVVIRIHDGAEQGLALVHQADGHAPVVQAVEKGRGAVDGIYDPEVGRGEVGGTALLAQQAIFRKELAQALADEVLQRLVGDAHHVLQVAALVVHLQRRAPTIEVEAELRRLPGDVLDSAVAFSDGGGDGGHGRS